MKVALDTSVVVAFLSKGGPQQAPSLQCYRHLRATGAQLVIADRVLIEAFSVLSRAPRLFSLPPRQAQAVLVDAFSRDEIAGPPPGFAWDVIAHTLESGVWGGRVHDAEIAWTVHRAGAEMLVTWNVRDFQTVAPAGLRIKSPETLVT